MNKETSYEHRTNEIRFLDLYLSEFDVGIWSSKCDVKVGKSMFEIFWSVGTKKEKEKQFKGLFFFWFLERSAIYKEGQIQKYMDKFCEKFSMKSMKGNTIMIVF